MSERSGKTDVGALDGLGFLEGGDVLSELSLSVDLRLLEADGFGPSDVLEGCVGLEVFDSLEDGPGLEACAFWEDASGLAWGLRSVS